MARVCPDFRKLLLEADPDAALIEQVAACYQKQLLAYARRRCAHPELAEDTVQETMVRLMSALGSYRGEGPLEAWLKRLVVTSCSRLKRGKGNQPESNEELPEEMGGEPGDDPEAHVLLGEQIRLLAGALTKLDEPNRTLLLRHEAHDVSVEELAREFSMSVDGVKSRLKRSRARLRDELLAAHEAVAA